MIARARTRTSIVPESEWKDTLSWLLEGDVSIQYQTYRDLLGRERKDLQARISDDGWGKALLAQRRPDGHWGDRFYQPKWTSTHYTLLDLRHLNIDPAHPLCRESVDMVATEEVGMDGGISCYQTAESPSDVCVNGMFLNYACYFGVDPNKLKSPVDFVLGEIMPDGGFNCRSTRSGAVHSSLHTTLSMLEGFTEYELRGYSYRLKEIREAQRSSVEFVLLHQLFLSDHTGEIIDKSFLRLSYPGRWRYDVLRALDYFQHADVSWDPRMEPAITVLLGKRRKDGLWPMQAKHPGQTHIEMEQAGKASRWNTLRALRVLQHFNLLD